MQQLTRPPTVTRRLFLGAAVWAASMASVLVAAGTIGVLELIDGDAVVLLDPISWLVATFLFLVRAVIVWFTIRTTIQEKFEPLLVEGEELLVQVAPQLAALA